MKRFKRLYDMFLKNGDLLEMFPELDHSGKEDETNSWARDKDLFIELQTALEENAISHDIDDNYIEPDPDEYSY